MEMRAYKRGDMTILEKEGEEVVDLLRLERKGARDAARRRNIMASLLVPAAWMEFDWAESRRSY